MEEREIKEILKSLTEWDSRKNNIDWAWQNTNENRVMNLDKDMILKFYDRARQELLKELIQICDDYSKDCIDLYELKLLLKDGC